MSELKATTVYDAYWKANSVGKGTGILIYLKSEVDKVIMEKDAEIEDLLRQNRELCQSLQVMYSKEEYGKLQKEIESLKAKLESVQASAYADSVDAGMRERRLRRALYKACANWAQRQHLDYYHQLHLGVPKSLLPGLEKGIDCWKKMERKCLDKAEEYR